MTNSSIIIRRSGYREDTRVSIDLDATTVEDLKNILEAQYNIDVSGKRIIFNGIILRDAESLSYYNVKKDSILHLIQPATNGLDQSAPNSAEDSNPLAGGIPSLKGAKSISSLLKAMDPEIISKIFTSNPQFKETMENNPEISRMISDPKNLRQGFEMMSNPEKMREVMKNNDRAISNLEMLPGGFNHLKKIYETIQQPMESAQRGNDGSTESANRRFAEMYGVELDDVVGVNTKPLPNPWAPPESVTSIDRFTNRFPKLSSMSSRQNHSKGEAKPLKQEPRFGSQNSEFMLPRRSTPNFDEYISNLRIEGSGNSIDQPTASSSDSLNQGELSARFADQIERLNEMGFDDLHQNLRALEATGGDVDDAVEFLLQQN